MPARVPAGTPASSPAPAGAPVGPPRRVRVKLEQRKAPPPGQAAARLAARSDTRAQKTDLLMQRRGQRQAFVLARKALPGQQRLERQESRQQFVIEKKRIKPEARLARQAEKHRYGESRQLEKHRFVEAQRAAREAYIRGQVLPEGTVSPGVAPGAAPAAAAVPEEFPTYETPASSEIPWEAELPGEDSGEASADESWWEDTGADVEASASAEMEYDAGDDAGAGEDLETDTGIDWDELVTAGEAAGETDAADEGLEGLGIPIIGSLSQRWTELTAWLQAKAGEFLGIKQRILTSQKLLDRAIAQVKRTGQGDIDRLQELRERTDSAMENQVSLEGKVLSWLEKIRGGKQQGLGIEPITITLASIAALAAITGYVYLQMRSWDQLEKETDLVVKGILSVDQVKQLRAAGATDPLGLSNLKSLGMLALVGVGLYFAWPYLKRISSRAAA